MSNTAEDLLVLKRGSESGVPRIRSDAHAIQIAQWLAETLAEESGKRDRERQLPYQEIDAFSRSGLWGITVPRAYGGAQVSASTLAEVVSLISEADSSIGQIPQNHYFMIEVVRWNGTEEQKKSCKALGSAMRFLSGEPRR